MISHTSSNDLKKVLKQRRKDSHKGENGIVLILAGSETFPGAAALAANSALSALRSGVDLVKVAAQSKVAFLVNSFSPDLITVKLKGAHFSPQNIKETITLSREADVVLVGPGIGSNFQTKKFVLEFVKKCKTPMVLDADAIKAVPGMKFTTTPLLTPHQKELEVFSGKKFPSKMPIDKKIKMIKSVAKRHNCTLLVKGPVDIIANPIAAKTNKTGNVRMTVGGTGDVLAGLCAAFIALDNSLLESAAAAAYLNGKAGDNLSKKKGRTFIASDLPEEISKIISKTEK